MPDRTDVVYHYDGSFQGFLCCVFQAYAHREDPALILSADACQESLFAPRYIQTEKGQAARVLRAIPQKMGPAGLELVRLGFLCRLPQRELLLLRLLRLGFAQGPSLLRRLTEEPVCTLEKAVRALKHEAHLYTGFVRFSEYQGALSAVITPKNQVLPLLASHFVQRFPDESFLIYDKTHHMALVHQGRTAIVPLENVQLPAPTEEERRCRALWQQFYQTVSIQQRENPRCQMSHMPKRFWADLTEDPGGLRQKQLGRKWLGD